MAKDIGILETSLRQRKGLLERLGDAGRFLADLCGGKDISPASVKKQITKLEQYLATCSDQIDEMGQQWEKADRHLADLNRKRKEASRAMRSTLLTQAALLLRQGEGYQDSMGKLKANGMSAQVLLENLRDLLILISGPMKEDAIDQWTTQLESAVEERAMSDKALDELTRVSDANTVSKEPSTEETEIKLDSVLSKESHSAREQEVERKLEELFE